MPDAGTPQSITPPAAPPKRPYATPQLEEFGSVSKLTTAKTGVSTDGTKPMSCL